MKTPICDFVARYAESGAVRLHMPGHKGKGFLGIEHLDITEISGADSLYEASGIIAESEQNASAIFGADTFYSTEGSSQCIRAMLLLAVKYAKSRGEKPSVLAGRNAHKTFLSAASLLDFEVDWIYPRADESYLSCTPSAEEIDELLKIKNPTALYLTSPDYLGNVADIAPIAEVCRKNGVLLLVDNAHGAYLKFLPQSRHPIDLGADICCDSAHKTLPVLGGGAYLHISKSAPAMLKDNARDALALFGSTSPSYLVLQSLDAANAYLAGDYRTELEAFLRLMQKLREDLKKAGFSLISNEPLKLTISAKPYGYTGYELADALYENNIVCEFCDPDFLTLMFTPQTGTEGIERVRQVLCALQRKSCVFEKTPKSAAAKRIMTIREAMLAPCEEISAEQSVGRVIASACVGCPPAVPIVVCGEQIDEAAKEQFLYYGIEKIKVIK